MRTLSAILGLSDEANSAYAVVDSWQLGNSSSKSQITPQISNSIGFNVMLLFPEGSYRLRVLSWQHVNKVAEGP